MSNISMNSMHNTACDRVPPTDAKFYCKVEGNRRYDTMSGKKTRNETNEADMWMDD